MYGFRKRLKRRSSGGESADPRCRRLRRCGWCSRTRSVQCTMYLMPHDIDQVLDHPIFQCVTSFGCAPYFTLHQHLNLRQFARKPEPRLAICTASDFNQSAAATSDFHQYVVPTCAQRLLEGRPGIIRKPAIPPLRCCFYQETICSSGRAVARPLFYSFDHHLPC